MLTLEDFITMVFCWVDDQLKVLTHGQRLRQRGFAPAVADSEVVAMELVGEFLGLDSDEQIWAYFKQHWHSWFPKLRTRSPFVRQAANLWAYQLQLQQALAQHLGAALDHVHLIDSFPMPVGRFVRAQQSRVFRGFATYGQRRSGREPVYGFCGQVVVTSQGLISAFTLIPANTNERESLWDVVESLHGELIGDQGYISHPLHDTLWAFGLDLQVTNLRSNRQDDRPRAGRQHLKSVRPRIETVIGQLSERFHMQKIRARDLWHLTRRLARKLLAHTVGIWINLSLGREPLQFDGLIKI